MKRRDLLKSLPFAVGATVASAPAAGTVIKPDLEPLEFAVDRFNMWEQAARITSDARLRSAANYLKHCMDTVANGDNYIVCINSDEAAFALIFGDGAQIKRRIDFGGAQ